MRELLSFGAGNAKLDSSIVTFSLPAGWSCPFARECLTKADRHTGKLEDGADVRFRCYAASQEAVYTSLRERNWRNFDLLKEAGSTSKMVELISASLPKDARIVRLHVSGDFFNLDYFRAWVEVAKKFQHIIFYAYTKAVNYWWPVRSALPKNFRLVASYGGTHDKLIEKYNLISNRVVFSLEEAINSNLPIDHDDSHAIINTISFATLLHGTQPANTEAAKAWQKIKYGMGGYGKNKKK